MRAGKEKNECVSTLDQTMTRAHAHLERKLALFEQLQ
jgi:hypothetical protein